MHRQASRFTRGVLSLIILGVAYVPVSAQESVPDQIISYVLHETPADPESAVVFTVELDLTAVDFDGDWVGWEVAEARFLQPLDPGGDTVWVEQLPFVDTLDGLWWIEHADPEAPVDAEFVLPPLLEGTAIAQDAADPDMDYSFEGLVYVPPPEPEDSPYETTGALDCLCWLVGEPGPEVDTTGDATEVKRDQDPPIGS